MSVPDKGYSINASCALNKISTFLLWNIFLITQQLKYQITNPLPPSTVHLSIFNVIISYWIISRCLV